MKDSPIADLEGIWNRFYPKRYQVDSELIKQNVFDCPLTIQDASIFDRDDGFIFIKYSGLPQSPDQPHARISAIAFDSETVGFELWAQAIGALRKQGVKTLQFGRDWRHFFPGCPVDFLELSGFLERCEMKPEQSMQHDLERDLIDYVSPCKPAPEARACVAEDRIMLDAFLLREFPHRWRIDTMCVFEENPERVIGLFTDSKCQGFALTQMDGDRLRLAGATWSADLGPSWAALGPIGVSKEVRGKGYGHGLLAAALCIMRDKGARQSIIDWTTLVDFYGKHGFAVSRTYRGYKTEL